MAVYAAMIEGIDASVGTIVKGLEARGVLDNTLIVFLSDNGGNAESGPDGRFNGAPPGGPNSNLYLGMNWAAVTTTPFRRFKHFTHEGGICDAVHRALATRHSASSSQHAGPSTRTCHRPDADNPGRDGRTVSAGAQRPADPTDGRGQLTSRRLPDVQSPGHTRFFGSTKATARFAQAGGNSSPGIRMRGSSMTSLPTASSATTSRRNTLTSSPGSARSGKRGRNAPTSIHGLDHAERRGATT